MLANKKTFAWFTARHLPFLKRQMQLQKKKEATQLKDLEKRLDFDIQEDVVIDEERAYNELALFKGNFALALHKLEYKVSFDALPIETQDLLRARFSVEKLRSLVKQSVLEDAELIEFLKMLPEELQMSVLSSYWVDKYHYGYQKYVYLLPEKNQVKLLMRLDAYNQVGFLKCFESEAKRQLFQQLDMSLQFELINIDSQLLTLVQEESLTSIFKQIKSFKKAEAFKALTENQQRKIVNEVGATAIMTLFNLYDNNEMLMLFRLLPTDDERLALFIQKQSVIKGCRDIRLYANLFLDPYYFYQAITTPQCKYDKAFIEQLLSDPQFTLFKATFNALDPQHRLQLLLFKNDRGVTLIEQIKSNAALYVWIQEQIAFIDKWSIIEQAILALKVALTADNKPAIKNHFERLVRELTDETDMERQEQFSDCLYQHAALRVLLEIPGSDVTPIDETQMKEAVNHHIEMIKPINVSVDPFHTPDL